MPLHNYVLRDRFEKRELARVVQSDPKTFRDAVLRSFIGLPPAKAAELETRTREELDAGRPVKRVKADLYIDEQGKPVSLQNVVEVPDAAGE